ncbi:MAG: hypothetical protein WDW38_001275 [Sanguina aurantia]
MWPAKPVLHHQLAEQKASQGACTATEGAECDSAYQDGATVPGQDEATLDDLPSDTSLHNRQVVADSKRSMREMPQASFTAGNSHLIRPTNHADTPQQGEAGPHEEESGSRQASAAQDVSRLEAEVASLTEEGGRLSAEVEVRAAAAVTAAQQIQQLQVAHSASEGRLHVLLHQASLNNASLLQQLRISALGQGPAPARAPRFQPAAAATALCAAASQDSSSPTLLPAYPGIPSSLPSVVHVTPHDTAAPLQQFVLTIQAIPAGHAVAQGCAPFARALNFQAVRQGGNRRSAHRFLGDATITVCTTKHNFSGTDLKGVPSACPIPPMLSLDLSSRCTFAPSRGVLTASAQKTTRPTLTISHAVAAATARLHHPSPDINQEPRSHSWSAGLWSKPRNYVKPALLSISACMSLRALSPAASACVLGRRQERMNSLIDSARLHNMLAQALTLPSLSTPEEPPTPPLTSSTSISLRSGGATANAGGDASSAQATGVKTPAVGHDDVIPAVQYAAVAHAVAASEAASALQLTACRAAAKAAADLAAAASAAAVIAAVAQQAFVGAIQLAELQAVHIADQEGLSPNQRARLFPPFDVSQCTVGALLRTPGADLARQLRSCEDVPTLDGRHAVKVVELRSTACTAAFVCQACMMVQAGGAGVQGLLAVHGMAFGPGAVPGVVYGFLLVERPGAFLTDRLQYHRQQTKNTIHVINETAAPDELETELMGARLSDMHAAFDHIQHLAGGLTRLRSLSIVICNLHPDNIALVNHHLCLYDFSRAVHVPVGTTSVRGAPCNASIYTAPELLAHPDPAAGNTAHTRSNVYTLGMVALELAEQPQMVALQCPGFAALVLSMISPFPASRPGIGNTAVQLALLGQPLHSTHASNLAESANLQARLADLTDPVQAELLLLQPLLAFAQLQASLMRGLKDPNFLQNFEAEEAVRVCAAVNHSPEHLAARMYAFATSDGGCGEGRTLADLDGLDLVLASAATAVAREVAIAARRAKRAAFALRLSGLRSLAVAIMKLMGIPSVARGQLLKWANPLATPLLCQVGSGGFGTVYEQLTRWSPDASLAVKVAELDSLDTAAAFVREVCCMWLMHAAHPFGSLAVVRLVFGRGEEPGVLHAYAYMELGVTCLTQQTAIMTHNAELESALARATASADVVELEVMRVAVKLASELATFQQQVANTLTVVADQRMCHSDVKAPNVVICAKGNAKVIDYGLSVNFSPGARTAASGGCTWPNAPPETLGGFGLRDSGSVCDKTDSFSSALMFIVGAQRILPTLALTSPGLSSFLCNALSPFASARLTSSEYAEALGTHLNLLHYANANPDRCIPCLVAGSAADDAKVEADKLYSILAFAELRVIIFAYIKHDRFVREFDADAALLVFHNVGWTPASFQQFMFSAARLDCGDWNAYYDCGMGAKVDAAAARFTPPAAVS